MKKVFIFFTITLTQYIHSQNLIWAYNTSNINSSDTSGINSMTTDSDGNIYATGSFSGTVDFDMSTSINTLTSSNSIQECFILKLDKDRNLIWVKQIKSNWLGSGKSIVMDNENNLILSGIASGNQVFLNPNSSTNNVVNNPTGITGSFIIKLNTNGEHLSSIFLFNKVLKESTIDNNNNIISTGNLTGFSGGSINNKIYIEKFNSNFVQLFLKDYSANNIYPHSIKCDYQNNIILKGNFLNSFTFSNINYTSNSYSNFIFKIDEFGNNIWFQKLGNTPSAGLSLEDKSIAIDLNNNIFVSTPNSSSVSNSNQIDFINTTINPNSNYFGLFHIIKMDKNRNLIWNLNINSNEVHYTNSLYLDNLQNLYSLSHTSNLNLFNNDIPIPVNLNFSNKSIILKTDSQGILIDNITIPDEAYTLVKDFEDNILTSGSFDGSKDFNPITNQTFFLNSFRRCGFIQKIGNCNPNPPVTESNQYFCSSQNSTIANLSPNNPSINWYSSINSITPLNNSLPLIDGQIYYVSKKIGNCPESQRLAVTVIINESPVAPIANGNQQFCESQNPTISNLVCTGTEIKWYDNSTGGNILSSNNLLQNNTTYYATQTVNGCESNKTPILVTIKPNPKPTINQQQSFCIQQNATINDIVITGQNIKWYDEQTGGSLLNINSLLQNGSTYYASQTINGCESGRVPVTIQIQNTPAPSGNANQTFCTSQSATVTNIITNGTNVVWYNSLISNTPLANSTLLTNNTTYYATQTINGCESVNRLAVTINLINTLNATNFSAYFCDDQDAGNITINLSGYNSSLISSTIGNTFSYYKTLQGAQNLTTSENITNSSNYILGIGTTKIYVRIDNLNTCHQIVELNLTLYGKPKITIPAIQPICEQTDITVNAGVFDSYLWSTGATTPTITITNEGDYSVTVTQNHTGTNCTATKNFTVAKSNIATIEKIITSDWTDNFNTVTILVTSGSVGDYEYSIDGINYQSSNVFTDLSSGEYTVYIKDKNGCGTINKEIYLLMYPKFFTPNGDGYNDYWRINFSNEEPNLVINIYDRFGKLLKQLSNDSQGWDGNYLGQPLPSDDYWFTVVRKDGKEYKAHFTLKR